jgi:hypothetical protein
MFNYPVEKHCIRFYKYKFLGFEDKPVIIEAYNKLEARRKLVYFIQQHPELTNISVIGESLTLPIYGETTKNINDVKHVWIGNGWIPLDEFLSYEENEN